MAQEYGQRAYFYAHLVSLFLGCVDREHGSILRFPYGDPLMDHPEGTRVAWLLMQEAYVEKVMRERQETISSMRSNRG